MVGILQPIHFFFIVLIVLILFGGNLAGLGKGLRMGMREFRDGLQHHPSISPGLKSALFMAAGVDPEVGRDVGDMLPDEEAERAKFWARSLLAVLIGNALFFISLFPVATRLELKSHPLLAVAVDAWFCLFAFGVLSLAALRNPKGPKR